MKRHLIAFLMIALCFVFYPGTGQCYKLGFSGQVSSLFVLRDADGFQNTPMDNLYGVQWRNTLDFEVTLQPEYSGEPSVYVEKVFMAYRGAYDAIFALTDRYDNVLEKERADYEIGRDNVEWENNLREIFVDCVAKGGSQRMNLRLGRQIVRWGETDSFNVVNVVNPQDYSYQMAFSNPDDLAVPLWMGRLDYTAVGLGFLDTFGIQILAIPDIEPTQLGPLSGKDGMADFSAPYSYTLAAYDGLGITRIREDVAADTLENMEYGLSTSFGVGSLQAALHYFVGHQHKGVLDWADYSLYMSPLYFGGLPGDFGGVPELTFRHPRQRTYGYSFNYFVEWANLVLRGEGSLTDEMYLFETPSLSNNLTGIAKAKEYQNMLGFDKDLHPSWIGTTSALSCGVEGYWKHVHDWKTDKALHPADKDDTFITTCLLYTDYHHGQIKPTILAMYDTEGTWMTNASIKYDPDGKWLFTLAQSSFWGNRNAISDFSYGGALINASELSFKVTYRF